MSVLPYIVLFNGIFLALQVLLMGLHMSQLVQVPSILGKAALLAACCATTVLFLRRRKRPPTRREAMMFAAGGTAVSASISSALLAGTVLFLPEAWMIIKSQTAPLGAGWMTAIFVTVFLAYTAILYFFFGPFARWLHEEEEYHSRRF